MWWAVLLAVGCAGAAAQDPVVLPAPEDRGRGLLLHASFDEGPSADFSVGSSLPYLAEYHDPLKQGESGRRVAGAFGQAITSVPGFLDALGNFLPDRGTIAFHLRNTGSPHEFSPLRIGTVDRYYGRAYLHLICLKGQLSARFPNEVFRIHRIPAGEKPALQDGRWHHLAVSWDQAYGAVLYLDGEAAGSSWGRASWSSRGVDPDRILLAWQDSAEYDELYVFDHPLSAQQVRDLATQNRPPTEAAYVRPQFDARRRQNRVRELSWETGDPHMIRLQLGARGPGSNAVRQIIPDRARAFKKHGGSVFDGKLGEGWPSPQRYRFVGGNSLSVAPEEPYDFMTIEGDFRGSVYRGRHLAEPEDDRPLREISSGRFMTRWRLDQPIQDWITLFEDTPARRPRQRGRTGETPHQIVELGLFRTGHQRLQGARARRLYLGPAAVDRGGDMGVQLTGRFPPGDCAVLTLDSDAPDSAGGQAIPGLRFHHVVVPATGSEWGLRGLRLAWWIRGRLDDNTLRIEMRDPSLPGRRLLALDFALEGGTDGEVQMLELTLDTVDRMIPPDRPLWISFVFKSDVELMWEGRQRASYLELLEDGRDAVWPEFSRTELEFAKTMFRRLSEPRPWFRFTEPERELTAFNRSARQLFTPLARLWMEEKDDPRVRALWHWTHPQLEFAEPVAPRAVPGHEDAPTWALLQRELLEGCRRILYWWIDERQAPSGEFGDSWGDDTDLIQNVPALALVADPNQRLLRAAKAVAEGTHASGLMTRGINARMAHPLHAYEEGTNAQSVMALLEYGDPVYLERLMQAARTVESHLTRIDEKGRRRFRSSYFSATQVWEHGSWGHDSPNHAVLMHPALLLGYYSRSPRAVRLVQEWIDGWLHYYREAEELGTYPPGRPYPARTLLDCTVLEWEAKARGYGYVGAYNGLYALTGEARYRQAVRFWTGEYAPRTFMRGNFSALPALELMDRDKYRSQLIAWADDADLSHPSSDFVNWSARQRYMKWEMTGDRAGLYEALGLALRNLRLLFDAYTWAEPNDDRIWLPYTPAIMMAQGEISHTRNQVWPRHYVSYEGLSDFAAWVRSRSDTHLELWIYSFASRRERGIIRVWRTPLGTYRVHFGKDVDRDGRPDAGTPEERTLYRHASIPIDLTPRTLAALEIRLVERSAEDFWKRPDLALSSATSTWEGNRLRVRVHNLGASPAQGIVVGIRDAAGNNLAERTIAHLEAPVDLIPRSQTLEFANLDGPDQVAITVDPSNRIPELNEENNRQLLRRGQSRHE